MQQKNFLLLAFVLLITLLLAACAPVSSVSQVPSTAAPATGIETALPGAVGEPQATSMPGMQGMEGMDHGAMMDPAQSFDAQFIDSMIEHHQGAITMAELALEQAEHQELRTLAGAIIAAQQSEIAQLEAWRTAWYPGLPPTSGMNMDMGDMMVAEDASIPFDRRFMDAMISHHRGAIMMAKQALTQAERAEIQQLAEGIIMAQEVEISQMMAWRQTWYGTDADAAAPAALVQGTVWVANEEGNSLTVIDAANQAVVTTLTGISGPHNVQVAPDGRTLWAVSGHDDLAIAIDAQSYSLLGTVVVGNEPAHVVVSPDGGTVWVSNSGDNTVSVIDTTTFAISKIIEVGDFPHGLRPSPDGKWVAVANLRGNTVTLIDAAAQSVAETIDVGAAPVQVAFAPDGDALYVTLNGEDAVAKIDLATRAVVGKADVGNGPVQVVVSPDSSRVLVANQGTAEEPSTTLSIIDAAGLAAVATVETGQGAHGVTVDPSGRYAYVTNLYGDDLAVVNLATQQVDATIPTGASPNGVSFSPLAPAPAVTEIALPLPAAHDDTDHDNEEVEEGDTTEHDTHH